jgi:bifunctional non-homologous end joining protein LigD
VQSRTSTGSRGRASNGLAQYNAKRDFRRTSEPPGKQGASQGPLSFVIQKHAASRLHYDFRLELDGVLVSWAVPKGPSFDPADKRLAVHVEDHPLSYGSFEGTIPPKQYGAGSVIVWDNGTWVPDGDPRRGLKQGKLAFTLQGKKLAGKWELVKIAKGEERQEPWLLFKKRDEHARSRREYDVVTALPDSVIGKAAPPEKPATRAASKPATKSAKKPARDGVARGSGRQPQGAIRAPLPEVLAPQLATLAKAAPREGEWIYEIKFDGYRIMTRIDEGKVRLITRNGLDWTAKMPKLQQELARLRVKSGWLDGEIIVPDAHGAPDFNALQKALGRRNDSDRIQYFLFDVPFLDGFDLRSATLTMRRQKLQALLEATPMDHVQFSAAFEADAGAVLNAACSMDLEGVIAKRTDATYVSGRTDSWLKLKCKQRQEFVIGGFVDRTDDARQIGSLVLGLYADGKLVPVGRVGTGWDTTEARELKKKLQRLRTKASPFARPPAPARWPRSAGLEQWIKPELVAEVEFGEWTADRQIRHASFIALRSDKPARSIGFEAAKDPEAESDPPSAKAAVSIKVSHGERIIDPSTKLTKLDLVRYYESVAPWILPHLKGRPCSLVRGPTGVNGPLFFQKHAESGFGGIRQLDASLWPEHAPLLEVDSINALLGTAQMNVIEFHTWNSRSKQIDLPDRMIFDLDPGEGTPWAHVQEGATLLRALLQELELQAWLKTSGGKGLHVVVPLAPRWDYDTVKSFSKAVVQHLARTIPARFVAKSGAANRIGKLFVDYLRNGHGATTAAAYSARARAGLGVSMPVEWKDLPRIESGAHWTIATALDYLAARKADPWATYARQRQSLVEPMRKLEFAPDA